MDGSRWTLRVTGPDPGTARVSVRQRQFDVGRPLEFDEASPRIAALEYALGALAGEVVGGLRELAWRHRVALDQIEATIAADLEHALAYLEVAGIEGRPRIARIQIKVFAAAPDEAAIRRLWIDLLDRLPLVGTFRAAVPLDLELQVTP